MYIFCVQVSAQEKNYQMIYMQIYNEVSEVN